MSVDEDHGWRAIIGSSSIMSLALLGDALLYAVLPVYASEFGLTLPWVGIMLSANRFVRVFAYGAIARLAAGLGLRKMCLCAAVTATVSTAAYGVLEGPALLLGARILWGLTYASLVLATLSYAVAFREKVGTRVGVGQAIQRVGPILALFGGAWLVGQTGPQMAFAVLAIPTALGILIALRLPRAISPTKGRNRPPVLARPKPIDVLFFLQGYGVDGVFAITITLIFARNADLSTAVMEGSALLAMRHFGEAIAAPLFGAIADKFGARRVFITAAVLTMVGFICVAAGVTVIGALVMLLFRGALASLGPAVIAADLDVEQDAIGPLARMQAWRDFGAALGPLVAGFSLAYLSAEAQHGIVACALAFGILYWIAAHD
ncbi:MFS transporter [Shimia sagamensis]|uniref:Predicted arabinose efflux permease, MFS family n=1 Tax=Shimia sagamensis TaxID=1566352 RepID=A0ABY1PID5_9RHOB|nr:MFS transporter [Shimia sagamensis]SMP34822.1 Predicted arabinose efflux permease, MFS family [Shimia sagamensis]